MQLIPLKPIASQTLTTLLGTQNVQIDVAQKFFGLFLNLYVNNALIIGGCVCQNLNRIVRSVYLGFDGDVCFWDTQGSTDPYYTGLGARYQLVYLNSEELAAIGVPTEGD